MGKQVSPAKPDEPVEMTFGGRLAWVQELRLCTMPTGESTSVGATWRLR